ncbi:MAG: SRPBCC domain-containing protein [Bacteroidetes bacterium]|nr:SRPBCC domain-containing protein [Bacteroidota bacterium]
MQPVFRYYLFTLLCLLLFTVDGKSQILCTPNEIRTEITINASAAEAWQLLTDFDAYANWHPYILQIEGKVALKEKIKVTTIDADSTTDKFSAFILVFEPNKQLAWGGSLGFIFSAKHYYIIEPINDNQILFSSGEYWHGIFGKNYGKKIYLETYQKFSAMNEKMKSLLEAE